MRSTLEGLCARWAVENITEEQIDRLEETILLSEFQMKKGNAFNTEQVTGLDGRFHTILYEASGSRMLARVLSDFHEYVQSARKDQSCRKNGRENQFGSISRSFRQLKKEMPIRQNNWLMNIFYM